MEIPVENALAFFPPSVKAGNVTLGPLTLAGAVRIGQLVVDLGRGIPTDKLFQVAWVLSGEGVGVRCRCTMVGALFYRLISRTRSVRSCTPTPNTYTFSAPNTYTSFLRHIRVGLKELQNAVETVLNDAFRTYVKPAQGKGGTVYLTPHGLGMPLEYAEFLCAEYGWSWETAINTPLARVFALVAAHRQRNGVKHGGFDYIEKHYAASLKKRGTVDRRKEEAV